MHHLEKEIEQPPDCPQKRRKRNFADKQQYRNQLPLRLDFICHVIRFPALFLRHRFQVGLLYREGGRVSLLEYL